MRAKIVAFDVRVAQGEIRPIIYANLSLPDGKIIAVKLPSSSSNCKVGDFLWLNKFENRFLAVPIDCRT
jgi:hypothetical protein